MMPEPSLRRLPWYLAYARMMEKKGEKSLSSTQIARGVGVEASVVAKDLSYIAVTGRTRVGYEIEELVHYIEDFLGFGKQHKAFLFGVGKLGAALLQDSGLEEFGLDIVAGFDSKYELSGTSIHLTPIHHVSRFEELQKLMNVEIGVLTVPVEVAQETATKMVEHGIKGIWNFTPVRIQVPDNIVVQNTSIYAHLALMYNRMNDLSER